MTIAEQRMAPIRRIKQRRSQKTYDAIIEAAFELLDAREFNEISVAEVAAKAGYSVGAFYARFKSKDELLEAMLARHLEGRRAVRANLFASLGDDELLHELLKETVDYYWKRRRFWRAALNRSISDPEFWTPVRALSHEFADAIIERMSARAGRKLTSTEETNTRFAVQLALGTINNAIFNRPGPILIGQAEFVDNLERAFRLVSGYDTLTDARAVRRAR